MVESTALEMRRTGNRIGGSNPSLSATCTEFRCNTHVFAHVRINVTSLLDTNTPVTLSYRHPKRVEHAEATHADKKEDWNICAQPVF